MPDAIITRQRGRDVSLDSDGSYCSRILISFHATFASSVLPKVTLSDKDLRVLVKFLDGEAVTSEKEVRTCDSLPTPYLLFSGYQRIS